MGNTGTQRKLGAQMLMLIIGYLLSPLSWWNDLFINLPIAYLFGAGMSLFQRRLFAPGMVAGYWFTNLLGLYLIQRAGWNIAVRLRSGSGQEIPPAPHRHRAWLVQVLTALGWTAVIVGLIFTGVLKPPGFIARAAAR
ncbi:MAG: hypothetical protein N2248_04905 [candidate division WOR-3 bacterium]|nr:hypothetical protein [candidate division WOR-3 bacterium]